MRFCDDPAGLSVSCLGGLLFSPPIDNLQRCILSSSAPVGGRPSCTMSSVVSIPRTSSMQPISWVFSVTVPFTDGETAIGLVDELASSVLVAVLLMGVAVGGCEPIGV